MTNESTTAVKPGRYKSEDWMVEYVIEAVERECKCAEVAAMHDDDIDNWEKLENLIIKDFRLDDDANPYVDKDDPTGMYDPNSVANRIMHRVKQTLIIRGY